MIGVVARLEDVEAAAEFFQLFKTPWEIAVPGRKYRVLLTATEPSGQLDGDVVLAYGSGSYGTDEQAARASAADSAHEVTWESLRIPIYAGIRRFHRSSNDGILDTGGGEIGYCSRAGGRTTWRIGYNLFGEVRHLLNAGQPTRFATIPTLELHIALLRHLLVKSGVSFVEVPPRPDKYNYICCLTHDIDFFGIRRHRWDRTLAGFVYRATVGTLVQLMQRRRTLSDALRNWAAALSLPLVFAGLRRDFWQPFDDYAQADGGRASTYFLSPFKQRAGLAPDGTSDSLRRLPYDVNDIQDELRAARTERTEFAVHGIDAWKDAESGLAEQKQLTQVTGHRRVGVRMHWLYSTPESTRCLEAAGFDYDSTCGYNEAVGFKSGTSQAFRPLGRSTLMQLPMSIMDSALFYPGRMSLSAQAALDLCRDVIAAVRRFGGTVVINWHDRSLAPERLWGRPYRVLLSEVENAGPVWFATCTEAVDWFRWRRSIQFRCEAGSGSVVVDAPAPPAGLPAGRVVIRSRVGNSDPEEKALLGGQLTLSVD
jgi:hypothetical protein